MDEERQDNTDIEEVADSTESDNITKVDDESLEGVSGDGTATLESDNERIARKRKRNLIINIALLIVIIALIIVLVVNKFVVTRMTVAGISMQPTLHDSEIVTVKYTKHLERGDIGVFTREDKMIVKRVIGVEGDRVRIDELGNVYRNGELLVEDYILDGRPICDANAREVTLGEGEYFILGDNRCNSFDSEDYGAVTRDHIIGKVLI